MAQKKVARMSENYGELSYNPESKKAFLNDAVRVMRAAGKMMGDKIAACIINKNEAGIAVSGEVYGYFILPDMQNMLMVEIGTSCIAHARPDRVIVMLQYRKLETPFDPTKKRRGKPRVPGNKDIGSNQWLDSPDINAEDLALFIEKHIRVHPEIIKARGNLMSDSFTPNDIPTVGEAIAGGGEIGKTLLNLKRAFDDFNRSFQEGNETFKVESSLQHEPQPEPDPESAAPVAESTESQVREIIQNARFNDGKMVIEQMLDRDLYLKVANVLKKWGGKWSSKDKAFVFDHDPQEYIDAYLSDGEIRDFKKDYQFFETPEAVAKDLVAMADIKAGHLVLEPSAGRGRIANVIRENVPGCTLHVCEIWDVNRQYLTGQGYEIVGHDFMQMTDAIRYDRIIMNPPFRKGQDVEHVLHAYNLLKPGGKLVAIMPPSWLNRDDKRYTSFREFVMERLTHGDKNNWGEYAQWGEFNEPVFRESGTQVKTGVLQITKTPECAPTTMPVPKPVLDIPPAANEDQDDVQSFMSLFG